MRNHALIMMVVVLGAAGCGRALTGVEPHPDAGGDAPHPTRPDALPGPIDAAPIPIPDPSCWTSQLPPDVQPLPAQGSVAEACAAGAAATTWSFPSSGPLSADDARALVVGRWAACDDGAIFPAGPHAGLELGANGRWRLLAADATGTLVPMTGDGTTGYYYQISTGQLFVMGEEPSPVSLRRVRFAAGMDAMRVEVDAALPGSIYARATPSPLNGNDNIPTVSDGRCSMVGTWDLPAHPNPSGAPAATFSFDAAGNFVGGPLGSDLCAAHTMYGTYRLSPGWFQLTSNVGLGACIWADHAGYPASFSDDCSRLTLMQMFDTCGGRGYFNDVTTMTRRLQ